MTTWQQRFDEINEDFIGDREIVNSPAAKKLYCDAWKECPAEIQKEIDSALVAFGSRASKFRGRFDFARLWLDGDRVGYQEQVTWSLDWPRRKAESLAKSTKREIEQEAEREAQRQSQLAANSTPEAIAARQQRHRDHHAQRLRKAAELIVMARRKGIDPAPKGNCVWCGKGLRDPLSRTRGVGPECWKLLKGEIDQIISESDEGLLFLVSLNKLADTDTSDPVAKSDSRNT